MSNKLQSLDSIQTLGGDRQEGPKDSVKKEYAEGLMFIEKKEFGQAAVAFHNALVGFEQRQDENGIANASNQLGQVCLLRSEYEGALRHFQRALGIVEKANDRMSTLAVLNKIVTAHTGLRKYVEAIAACLDMLELYQDNRDPQGTVVTLETMAEIYLEDGQREKAADAYRTIGSIHKNFRHDTTAAQYLEKAAHLETVVQNPS
ncbi:MAG: tetratricopeptide repeat protein [Proteobacteria bacterium]|nr:tetratricopeptide repeat protein [Pseudomonadota bacterium]